MRHRAFSPRREVKTPDLDARIATLEDELANFRSMMEHVNWFPDHVSLVNIQMFGEIFPLNGVLGGDHIVVVDFKRRYNLPGRIAAAREAGHEEIARSLEICHDRVGVLLADAAGHETTDALLTAMLHQAFLTGVLYELETQGEVTSKLFEILNNRFHKSLSVNKYLTMIYGEISEEGAFRFISAGHPKPLIFSAEFDRFVEIDPERTRNFLPIGVFASEGDIDDPEPVKAVPLKKRYTVNEVNLMGKGDILMLATDGLYEHADCDRPYVPGELERTIQRVKGYSPREIVGAIREDMLRFAPPQDDASLFVIKKVR